MPLDNNHLKLTAALDPQVRKTRTCQRYLKKALKVEGLLEKFEKTKFRKEVLKYTSDPTITDPGPPIDVYWGKLVDANKYPLLVRLDFTDPW